MDILIKLKQKKIHKDIARLSYLKEQHKDICNGYFLMITDENPYFKSSTNRDNTFDTANNIEADLKLFKEDYHLKNDYTFKFIWKNINKNSIKGKFAWLKYIKV